MSDYTSIISGLQGWQRKKITQVLHVVQPPQVERVPKEELKLIGGKYGWQENIIDMKVRGRSKPKR